jgi:hypothetical protein
MIRSILALAAVISMLGVITERSDGASPLAKQARLPISFESRWPAMPTLAAVDIEEEPDAVVPDPRRADDLRPVHAEARRELPASHSRDQQHRERLDPVCGKRGRTWYTKANGWRYWRCNR